MTTRSTSDEVKSRFHLPESVDQAIKDIKTDHDSGARQLALKALRALDIAISSYPADPSSWRQIVNCAWEIVQARPSMKPAIQTAIVRALYHIQSVYPQSKETAQAIKDAVSAETHRLDSLCQHFVEYFSTRNSRDRISMLTLSNSSTMVAALQGLFKSDSCPAITLTILESRPLLEGVSLAKLILPTKPPHVEIQIATDASAAYFASKSDYVLIGADQIDPLRGRVKNKMGSATAARFARGTVLCISGTDKLDDAEGEEEENDAEEVVKVWDVEGLSDVRVRNVYFEWVDARDVDTYVTELGVLRFEELEEMIEVRKEWFTVWHVLGD
jgi:translation initiation factor 2B subunit (eIF-2B alpha/beta/delta family)